MTDRPGFAHLATMTDARGTFEHARFAAARREHGYCTDDAARVLVVASRERDATPETARLLAANLGLVIGARVGDRFRNRLEVTGRWLDEPSLEDCWGRALWGLGTTAARATDPGVRERARREFTLGATSRSPWRRAMAFAGLGAVEVLDVDPVDPLARALAGDVADRLMASEGVTAWTWPEQRLRYANAAVPEALIACGAALQRPAVLARGLELLSWLLLHERHDDHLSVTASGGAGPSEHRPGFAQQPIEVAAIADACARAGAVDDDPQWAAGLASARAWFNGANDLGARMWDTTTHGGYDGLEADGPNLNEGAESTLALLSTFQHAPMFATSNR